VRLLQAIRERGPLWVATHTALWFLDRATEFVLYPIVIYFLGPVSGIAVMMLYSFLVCWGLIVLYDWVSNNWIRDTLGFETLKEAGEGFEGWLGRTWPFTLLDLRSGSRAFRAGLFVYLSVMFDPMTCLIIMRPKDRHAMGIGEWKTFLGSVVLSNVSWGILIWFGIETITELWGMIW